MSKWHDFERSAKKKLVGWGLVSIAAACLLAAIWTESWQWGASGAVALGVAFIIAIAVA